jgi:hypothetical protein
LFSAAASASATSDSVIKPDPANWRLRDDCASERAVNPEHPAGISKEIRKDSESELAPGTVGVIAACRDWAEVCKIMSWIKRDAM